MKKKILIFFGRKWKFAGGLISEGGHLMKGTGRTVNLNNFIQS